MFAMGPIAIQTTEIFMDTSEEKYAKILSEIFLIT